MSEELHPDQEKPVPDTSQPQTELTSKSPPRKSAKEVWLYRISIAIGLLAPVFLETIDYTVVATAQPHIASAFNRLDLQRFVLLFSSFLNVHCNLTFSTVGSALPTS